MERLQKLRDFTCRVGTVHALSQVNKIYVKTVFFFFPLLDSCSHDLLHWVLFALSVGVTFGFVLRSNTNTYTEFSVCWIHELDSIVLEEAAFNFVSYRSGMGVED
jgi:hypothetical protein